MKLKLITLICIALGCLAALQPQPLQAGSGDESAISFRGFTSLASEDSSFETDSVFTMEIWFRTTKTNGLHLLTHEDQGASNFAQLRVNPTNPTVRFVVRDEANNVAAVDSPDALADGLWHHAAGVRDGATLRLYIDGVLVRETTNNTDVDALNIDGPVKIGRWLSGSGATLLEVDEARIWHTARTEAEIADNRYRSVASNATGLVGYWPMAAGSGTTVTDATGAGNDMEFVNSGAASPLWAGRAWAGGDSRFDSSKASGVGINASSAINEDGEDITVFPTMLPYGVSMANVPATVTSRWAQHFLISVREVASVERGGSTFDITFDILDAGGSGTFDPTATYSLLRRGSEIATGSFVVVPTQNVLIDGSRVTFTVDSSNFGTTIQQITIGTDSEMLAVGLSGQSAASGTVSAFVFALVLAGVSLRFGRKSISLD